MAPITLDPVIAGRIRKAWQALSPGQQAEVAPLLAAGNKQAEFAANADFASFDTNIPRALLFADTVLTSDASGILGSLSAGTVMHVASDGTLLGTGKYETFDPGWAEAFAVWLEHIPQKKGPFSINAQVIGIPDKVTIALTGDWGTGDWRRVGNPAPATKVAKSIAALHPDFTIHLGDVYYSGTTDEEQHLLLNLWPRGTVGALALNSNHEMYSGGKPYFLTSLDSPLFSLQQHCSFFALESTDWIIVGLDSAYYSDEMELYMHGSLGKDGAQVNFLRQQTGKGKKVIVLTHRDGLVQDGSGPEKGANGAAPLYSQVLSAFPPGMCPAYWYWAHVHSAVVYRPQDCGVQCRCCGHGALPQGDPSGALNGKKNVLWYQSGSAHDPDIPQRILNGFVFLSLDGPVIRESFYDENGQIQWHS
jgi:hypothetical protein